VEVTRLRLALTSVLGVLLAVVASDAFDEFQWPLLAPVVAATAMAVPLVRVRPLIRLPLAVVSVLIGVAAATLLAGGGASDVGARPRLQRRRREVPLGALAVGDYPHPGRRLAQGPDRFLGVQDIVCPARVPAQIDDRHVDAADIADQADRLAAALGLVDLELTRQRLAHAEADQRVGVDHKAVWALAQNGHDPIPGKIRSVR